MVKITALYGHPTDPDAFERYYKPSHVPYGLRIPGLKRLDLSKAAGTFDGSPPAYHRVADLWFENMDALQKAFASVELKEAVEDLDRFATGGVTIFFSDVDELVPPAKPAANR
jgi:uncharacterized protein (TIGR02118 family)